MFWFGNSSRSQLRRNVVDMLRGGPGDLLLRVDGPGEPEQGVLVLPRGCNSLHGVPSLWFPVSSTILVNVRIS